VTGLVEKLPDQGRLDLLVDCPSAPEDVPKVVEAIGSQVTGVVQLAPGEWRIAIRK
jgi:TusA-related sulfurtransferase